MHEISFDLISFMEMTQWTQYCIKKVFFLLFFFIYYWLMLYGTIFFFCSCRVIALPYFYGKMAPFTAILDAISPWFSAMYNYLLRVSGVYPADKIEERITFALSYARLYLSESYDHWDNNFVAVNAFDISCGGGGSLFSI